MEGKFIVIDGTDGAGKGTQTALLVERLRKEGHSVETIDFPQYGKKSAGLVEEYLNGVYGTAEEVGPYRASIFYAADRYDGSFLIRKWLDEGKIVISNRYVTANMGHQGAKIKDDDKLNEYLDWLYHLEYELFGIPKPDLNLILHITPELGQQMVDQKASREYVNGKKRDIHEADINHLRAAEQTFLKIAGRYPEFFRVIECETEGEIRTREEIAEEVWITIKHLI